MSTRSSAKTASAANPKLMGGPSIGSKVEAKIGDPETPLILRVFSKAGKIMRYLKALFLLYFS